jgi:hypothetical protein
MVKLHEKGGCYLLGESRPGLSKEQVEELVPGIIIPEGAAIDEGGWWKAKQIETTDQCV